MKHFMKHLAILSMAIFSMSLVKAQDDWPKVITASDGTVIKVNRSRIRSPEIY
jgi:ABC-type Fe2+-enterobactin transport system substrate-binding protein